MSLATDSFFIDALRADASIVGTTEGRIYGTAIPLPDEDADNTPVPYIIVTFDNLANEQDTKDCDYEGMEDAVTIGVEVTAKTLTALHQLTQAVRDAVLGYFTTNDTPVQDYQFSAQAIQFDALKPCYWQVLNYRCTVYPR